MNIKQLKPCKKGILQVIIETPQYSQNKFAYDPELKIFRLKKTLPLGSVFPFNFGFIPNTVGEDGDPLDALVIMEGPTYPGCLVESRVCGVLEATQTEGKGKTVRNDRIVSISLYSILYADIKNIKELNKNMLKEIENFFIDYNKHEGRQFKPIGWADANKAVSLIKKSRQ